MQLSRKSIVEHQLMERFSASQLGEFNAAQGYASQTIPTLSNDAYPLVTTSHEGVHRDLTMATDIGLLEILFARMHSSDLLEDDVREKAGQHLAKIVESSWMTHESAAVFGSVSIALEAREVDSYLSALPEPYREAYAVYEQTFSNFDMQNPTVRKSAAQIAKCISQLALCPDILRSLGSNVLLNSRELAREIFSNGADKRQKELLSAIKGSSVLPYLIREGANRLALNTFDMNEIVAVLAAYDAFFIETINRDLPEICTMHSLQAGLNRRRAYYMEWQDASRQDGLGQFVDSFQIQFEDPIESPEIDVDTMYDASVNVSPDDDTYLASVQFQKGNAGTATSFSKNIADNKTDTLVFLTVNPLDAKYPVDTARFISANHSMIHALPWRFGEPVNLFSGRPALPGAVPEPFYFEFKTSHLPKLAEMFDLPQVVWSSVIEIDELSGGHRAICRKSAWHVKTRMMCSLRDVKSEANRLRNKDGAIVVHDLGSDNAQSLFLSIVDQLDKSVVIHPVTEAGYAFLVEQHVLDGLTILAEDSPTGTKAASVIRLTYMTPHAAMTEGKTVEEHFRLARKAQEADKANLALDLYFKILAIEKEQHIDVRSGHAFMFCGIILGKAGHHLKAGGFQILATRSALNKTDKDLFDSNKKIYELHCREASYRDRKKLIELWEQTEFGATFPLANTTGLKKQKRRWWSRFFGK